jgi:hypothetical protein
LSIWSEVCLYQHGGRSHEWSLLDRHPQALWAPTRLPRLAEAAFDHLCPADPGRGGV